MIPQPPPELKAITAKEAVERGKAAALAEAMRLISINVAYGEVLLPFYPPHINNHLRTELTRLGYEMSLSPSMGCLRASWSP